MLSSFNTPPKNTNQESDETKINLAEYVTELNQLALREDLRSLVFIPPKGFVINCYCYRGRVKLGLANGIGGFTIHDVPENVISYCSELSHTKKKSLFQSFLKLFKKNNKA